MRMMVLKRCSPFADRLKKDEEDQLYELAAQLTQRLFHSKNAKIMITIFYKTCTQVSFKKGFYTFFCSANLVEI